MKQYLRWGQVQERLIRHYQDAGAPYSFFDAARELWEEGRFYSAPALPPVSFLDWDGADLEELVCLLDQVPVDLDGFYRDFERGLAASDAAEQIDTLNITPGRTARYQAQGIHTHDSFEIVYTACGNARLICGGSSHALPAGSLCMVSPHFPHESVAGDDCILLLIMLSEQDIENTLFRLLRQESIVSDFFRFNLRSSHNGYLLFHGLNSKAVLPLFRGLLHEFYSAGEYFREACANYLEQLFIYLLRQNGKWYGQKKEKARRGALPLLAILKHIQLHYKTTTLHETAALFHYEPNYLGKQIRLHTGKTYVQLVGELRIADAKRLLRDTDLSIARVAAASGFRSVVHFSRSFHKAVGTTPSDWRKTAAGQKD